MPKGQLKIKQNSANKIKKSEHFVKIIMVGDGRVGKTSLLNRYKNNKFTDQYKSTNHADYVTVTKELENGEHIDIEIWEIGNRDCFSNMGNSYMRDAGAVIYVADVTVAKTFANVDSWREEVQREVQIGESKPIQVLMLTKAGVEDQRVVSYKGAQAYANKKNMIYYFGDAKENFYRKQDLTTSDITECDIETVFAEVIELALVKQSKDLQEKQKSAELIQQI